MKKFLPPKAQSRADWNAILARLEFIGDTLRLPYSEIARAAADEEALVDFAERHNQSLDWICRGSLKETIWTLKNLKATSDQMRQRDGE